MDFNTLITTKKTSETKEFLSDPFNNIPSIEDAIKISKKYSISLHPRYLFYWNELSSTKLIEFLEFLKKGKQKNESIFFPNSKEKRIFEILGIEHTIKKIPIENIKSEEDAEIIILNKLNSKILLSNLGIDTLNFNLFEKQLNKIIEFSKKNLSKTSCEILSQNSNVEIRDKGGSYIGARMGRPEKAKMRKLDGRPQGLFTIGEGEKISNKKLDSESFDDIKRNRERNIITAIKAGSVEGQFRIYYCQNCNKETIYPRCEICDKKTNQKFYENRYSDKEVEKENEETVYYKRTKIELDSYVKNVRKILKSIEFPKLVKGVRGTSNQHRSQEHLSKAFLRALNNIYVNKDGTVRFDMIEMGLTHFKPLEIGTSVEKLISLGYTHDYQGNSLTRNDQILEIYPQDVILPDCSESGDELASDFVINTGNFVDDLLEKLYKLPRFYNFKTKEDTIGHLLIGLAPHTSAGIIGRIIGYSKTQGCFSHPVWHAAQRRNLDGDENGVMLLLDGLINTSREYLPDRRGAKTMDVSLVLTSHLYLDQIDDEVHGMDIVNHYPLEFYKANKQYASPKSIKIEKVEKRIDIKNDDEKYRNYKFTHSTSNMNNTIMCSSYKSVPSMKEKLHLQLELGRKIRAVDEHKVGALVIDKHFMKDLKGNLRKFGMQSFRCTNCNESYRRPPLNGRCTNCNMPSINFTIHEGSIKKYLQPSFDIIKNFDVDPYIAECVELINLRIEGVFGKELEKQKGLNEFFKK